MGRDIMYLISQVDQSIRDCSLCNVHGWHYFLFPFCILYFVFYILHFAFCILFFAALCAMHKTFICTENSVRSNIIYNIDNPC